MVMLAKVLRYLIYLSMIIPMAIFDILDHYIYYCGGDSVYRD